MAKGFTDYWEKEVWAPSGKPDPMKPIGKWWCMASSLGDASGGLLTVNAAARGIYEKYRFDFRSLGVNFTSNAPQLCSFKFLPGQTFKGVGGTFSTEFRSSLYLQDEGAAFGSAELLHTVSVVEQWKEVIWTPEAPGQEPNISVLVANPGAAIAMTIVVAGYLYDRRVIKQAVESTSPP